MQTIEFVPLLTTPGAIQDPMIILVGEVPYEELKVAYVKHNEDDREVILVNLSRNPDPEKVAWYLNKTASKQVYYINKRIESAPALFHHLDKLEAGKLLEDRVQHVYLARYSTPDALLTKKISYYQTLLMRRFGYTTNEIETLINDVSTQKQVLDNLRVVFNREMEKSTISNRYLEASELEYVR